MEGVSAYGAALAGRGFDFHKFVRQPQTIVRLLSWVFAVVVFGCITTEGYINPSHSNQVKCIFNQNDSACQFAVAIGVLGFLACLVFVLLDVYVPFMSNVRERKYAVVADLGFSGAWAFLWFVCFCLLANQWSLTQDVSGIPEDAARAAIAFSFFSIATWGILTYFALGRFRRGVSSIPTYTEPPPPTERHTSYDPAAYTPAAYTPTSYNPAAYTPTTYTAYPGKAPDVSQQPTYAPTPSNPAAYTPTTYTPYPGESADLSHQPIYTPNIQPLSDYEPK